MYEYDSYKICPFSGLIQFQQKDYGKILIEFLEFANPNKSTKNLKLYGYIY
jgi:hypothetical protein